MIREGPENHPGIPRRVRLVIRSSQAELVEKALWFSYGTPPNAQCHLIGSFMLPVFDYIKERI